MVVALVFAQFAQAQTVDDVLDKYMAAMGGKDKLLSITSVFMQGVSEANGNEITNTTWKVQEKLFRNDINFGMGSITTVVTPEKGWRSNPRNGGAFEAMTAEALNGYLHQMDCAGPLVNYAAKGHKAELMGKDTVDKIECYKIKLTTKAGKELTYWIDAKTYLIYQNSQKGNFGGREFEITYVYKDYKAVDGILFPYTAELKGGAGGFNSGPLNYEKIEINKPVDAKLYKAE